MELEREQEELFDALVERARSVPRAEREDFVLIVLDRVAFIQGPGGHRQFPDFQPSDLHVLHDASLIGISKHTKRGGFTFYVTPRGFSYYEERKHQAGGPSEQAEQEIGRYLDADHFRTAYPTAHAKWGEAAALLWGSDSQGQLTTIGHLAREAIQEFATALVDRLEPPEVSTDPAKTVARLRAVLDQRRPALADRHAAVLDALVPLWGTISDLIQRQEHGAQKEGRALTWEDGRRVVFLTAVVMFEVDRSISG